MVSTQRILRLPSYARRATGSSCTKRQVCARFGSVVLLAALALTVTTRSADALEIIREVEPKAKQQNQRMVGGFPDNILDQWVFNGQAKFSTARKTLQKKLDAKLKVMTRVCKVTEAQRMKMNLAGQGDIHAFMRECEVIQRGFDPQDQNQINNIWQEVQPLRNKFNGNLFGQESMFERVLASCLSEDQYDSMRKREAETRKFAIETSIRQMISQIDEASPLTNENRDKLTELLVKEIPVPASMQSAQQKQMAMQYVMYACNNVDEDDLKPCFDEDGWKRFRQAMRNSRGLKQHFRQTGMIE